MPGLGQSWICFCILSPDRVIVFPHILEGAAELRAIIQNATGMRWPKTVAGLG